MELTYIFLAICVICLILLLLSPRFLDSVNKPKKRREIDEVKFAESKYSKRRDINESNQYAIMRTIVAVSIGVLGIYGASLDSGSAQLYLVFALIFVILSNIAITCGHMRGLDVLAFTKYALVGKVVAQILLAIAFSILIENGTVCIATILLGFIVGAVYFKLLVHNTTAVHSYFALANSLKFSNLGLAIIALLYNADAFSILLLVGYAILLAGSTFYVVNKKGLEFASSTCHYLGYILIALSLSFI